MARQNGVLALREFLSDNADVLFAVAALILVAFLQVGRFLLPQGTILFGDFVPTLQLNQFFRVNSQLWSNRNTFNYVGMMRLPYLLVFYSPFYLSRSSAEVFFKFIIYSTLVISGISMYVTVRHFLGKYTADKNTILFCSTISSLFYAFNPWVMDRVEHFFLLVTYMVIPVIFLLSMQAFSKEKFDFKRVFALVLFCLVGSTDPHSVFFILFLVFSLYLFLLMIERKQLVTKTKNLVSFTGLYGLFCAFWLLPLADYSFYAGSLSPDYVTHLNDLNLLSSNSNLPNVIRLVSYWWLHVNYSFETFPLSVLWILASMAFPILCFSAIVFYKRDKTITYLSLLGVVLIFLAGGTESVVPGFYGWLCFYAPILSSFGWLFRDPNKWVLLLPLAYSMLLAFACLGLVEMIRKLRRPRLRKASTVGLMFLLFSLLFIYVVPSTINHFEGPFKPVNIPSEIYDANSWIKNDSANYNVLWMPSYAEYGATWAYDELTGAFELDSSARPTFDSNSKYVRGYLNYFDRVLVQNRDDHAAAYLNPLNVRYIIFHNDSANEDYTNNIFQSLERQKDLELVRHDGTVYIFENKGWTNNVFNLYEKTAVVTGSFDRFVSLNALLGRNSSGFALVFADQSLRSNYLDADTLILEGDSFSDALPFFFNESLVIAPFDFAKNYDPSNVWSKASLSDLLGGSFNPYLEQFGVECWGSDYDKGAVFTSASSQRLDMSFDGGSGGNFTLFARVFENAAGGSLDFYVDGKTPETVDTRSQTDRFVWKLVGVFSLTSGTHSLTLENTQGLNAVNLVAVMSEQRASELFQAFANAVQTKNLLYVLEAESDMFSSNVALITSHGSGWSNGAAVELAANSSISESLELACSGNYTLIIKGSGRLLINIDRSYYSEITLPRFGSAFLDPVNLGSGLHQIEVSPFGNNQAELDVLWLIKPIDNLDFLNNSGLDTVSARILNVKENSPMSFKVEIDADKPFLLHFSDAYDPSWTASFSGKTVGSERLFGVANGFKIDVSGKTVLTVELGPQKWFLTGSVISVVSVLVCLSLVAYSRFRKKRKETVMNSPAHDV